MHPETRIRAQPVHLVEASRFLRSRYHGGATDVAELGGGDWSRAFSFNVDGWELVARFGQHREDFEADREAMAYSGPDLPVPEVLEIGEALGGAYAISQRHHGVFLETLDAVGWQRLLPALWRGLDALREQPAHWPQGLLSQPGLADGPAGLWGAHLLGGLVDHPGERVSGWRQVLAASCDLDELFIAAQRRVAELLKGCPTAPHLLHADLLNRNVLVSVDATRLVAVFDWGCLKHGDFLYELAWFTFWAPWHPGLAAVDIRSAALNHYQQHAVAVPHFEQRLRCYELHIGLEHLAYCAFTGNDAELQAVAERTRALLEAA